MLSTSSDHEPGFNDVLEEPLYAEVKIYRTPDLIIIYHLPYTMNYSLGIRLLLNPVKFSEMSSRSFKNS